MTLIRVATRTAAGVGCPASNVPDVAQETVIRLCTPPLRQSGSTLIPLAIVIARNLAVDVHRAAERQQRLLPRLAPSSTAANPEDVVVAAERSAAMRQALAVLDVRDRDSILAHADGTDVAHLGGAEGRSPSAVAARLARTRARLRLEYVLALRRLEPPAQPCRSVLLSLSMNDRRRQHALGVRDHLLACSSCRSLAPPLVQRSSNLA